MFRAEVVGSMLRPAYLKEARAAREGAQITVPEFKRIEDRAVDQVIAMEEPWDHTPCTALDRARLRDPATARVFSTPLRE